MTNTEYQRIRDVLTRVASNLHILAEDLSVCSKKDLIDPRGVIGVCIALQNLLNGLGKSIPVLTEKALDYTFSDNEKNSMESLVNDIFKNSDIKFSDEESENPFDKFMVDENGEDEEGFDIDES